VSTVWIYLVQTYKYVRLDAWTGDDGSTARYARMHARRGDGVFAPTIGDDDVEVVWMQFYEFTLNTIDYADLAQRVDKTV